MKEQEQEKMTPLDQMIAQDQLQMLKAAIPYASPSAQPMLSVFAKLLELEKTIQLFSRPAELSMMSKSERPRTDPMDMLSDISRFATGEHKETLDQIITAFQAFQMMQTYQEDGNGPEL